MYTKGRIMIEAMVKNTGYSRVILSPTELKMQPTIHLESKPGY
jgi:hypothetical protein